MNDQQTDLQARLQKLRESYAAQLPARLDTILQQWGALQEQWKKDTLEDLHRAVHSLSGSGSTFGYAELSQQARKIEVELKNWLQEGCLPNETQQREISEKLLALRTVTGTASQSALQIYQDASKQKKGTERLRIYLLEDDPTLATDITVQLKHFNYAVSTFVDSKSISTAIKDQRPDAIIADIAIGQDNRAGLKAVSDIHACDGADLPVIFLSSRDDFDARLEAVRAGGHAYFTKPADIPNIIDQLDQLTQKGEPEPYRILVIDDDETLATHYALTLRQAGMEVAAYTKPEDIMEALVNNQPELILMDVYMPACTGAELSRLIRQQEAFLGIPIIFLSTETNQDIQMATMDAGGDDFLTKPITDEHLVMSVITRAKRARTISNLIDKDSLTGLLKHTKIKERLANEVSRAKRNDTALSFAMIDIDHFKQVNDQYGHLSGDQVIKSLARLLRQRLRDTDIIGRYGGEEFAVILPDCNAKMAAEIMNEVRRRFQELRFLYNNKEFTVSFSAGIATYPHYKVPELINKAADEALYEAKHQGRNRVVCAKKQQKP